MKTVRANSACSTHPPGRRKSCRRSLLPFALLYGLVPFVCQGQGPVYELLRVLGSVAGVRPPERLSGRYGKLLFGKPAPPLLAPDSVTVDPRGRVWITDRGTRSVHMFDTSGNTFKVIGGNGLLDFQCPAGIDADSMGYIYVADSCLSKIFVFDRDGKFVRFLAGSDDDRVLKRPTALAVSRDRKIVFVLDAARSKLVVFNQEGEAVTEWDVDSEPGRASSVTAVDGKVYVLGGRTNEVSVFSGAGALLATMKWDQAKDMGAFAYDAERRIYFAGSNRLATVLAFGETGELIGAFGQRGAGVNEMSAPGSIYVDAIGQIYVVDTQNAKVLVFREKGAGKRAPRPPDSPEFKRRGK